MELLLLFGAILTLDLLALEFGYDSRQSHAVDHHDRAVEAVRRGDMDLYRLELARMERDIARGEWRLL